MKQGWEIKRLGNICETSSGGTPSKSHSEYYENGNIPWLRSGEISQGYIYETELYITEEGLKKSSAKIFPTDTVVIAMYGATVGQVGVLKMEMSTNQAVCGIYPTPMLSPLFLVYYLKAKKPYFLSLAAGGAQPNISQNIIKNTPIPVPTIAEQENIVAELDCLSGIIEKKKQQLKEYDALAQSIFYEMFGNPIDNEKGWDIKNMEELFDIGSSKRVFEAQWTDSGVPFYRAREIVKLSKGESIDAPIFISEELYNEYSKKYGVPSKGDMMVTAVGTLGVCYIVKSTDRFYFKDGNTLWFKSKGICDTQFIKDEFATEFVVNQIKGNANAAVVGTYTITNAKKTKVIVPPLTLQQEYVKKIEAIEKQKELIKQSIAETETLFNSRMDYYFN